MEDFPYEAEQFTLAPDETMVIITDGVTEARAPNGDLFGMPRLLSHLETVSDRTADTVIQSLVTAVRGFEDGEPPTDDLTVLAIRQKPE
jgi:sigma-B regulation protein RsbU (phosphoserine phosphatase)